MKKSRRLFVILMAALMAATVVVSSTTVSALSEPDAETPPSKSIGRQEIRGVIIRDLSVKSDDSRTSATAGKIFAGTKVVVTGDMVDESKDIWYYFSTDTTAGDPNDLKISGRTLIKNITLIVNRDEVNKHNNGLALQAATNPPLPLPKRGDLNEDFEIQLVEFEPVSRSGVLCGLIDPPPESYVEGVLLTKDWYNEDGKVCPNHEKYDPTKCSGSHDENGFYEICSGGYQKSSTIICAVYRIITSLITKIFT